jgi:glucosylceramidase
MKRRIIHISLLILFVVFVNSLKAQTVQSWVTNADKSALFSKQPKPLAFSAAKKLSLPSIAIDDKKTYQQMDGFGFTLTGGSAQHLMKMSREARTALLKELFSYDRNNIGISYLRVSIAASDLDSVPFSYTDLPEGATDVNLQKFNLGPDYDNLIPVLKEILAIAPDMKILGSPWSAPKWMKTNNDTRGGSLKKEYYDVYAHYLVRYIQEMKRNGIHIDAITVQNEPLHPGNNPSMYMPAEEQGQFVKTYLGPAFASAGLDTKIIIYDHNANRPDYPISILNDPDAKKYIDGSAFHLYEGKIEALSEVHKAHPDKNLYFTEQWIGSPSNFGKDLAEHVNNLTIGATRNWCKTVLEWNLSSNPQLKPHTDRGGCDLCLGGITLDGDKVTRNVGYYIVAHASKFVRPGSLRIGSNLPENLNNVAFLTPKGEKVVIVINNSTVKRLFSIRYGKKSFTAALSPGAVGTYVWK